MSEQPGSDRPAEPPAAGEPAAPDARSAANRRDEPPTEETAAEEATAESTPGGSAAAEETAAAQARPRWTGSAAVPPPAPRKRRWLQTAAEDTLAGRQPDPTRDLPTDEHESPESATPVDPWAGADLWGPHGPPVGPAEPYSPSEPYPPAEPYSPTEPYPPTRQYPVNEPAPPARPDHRPPTAPAPAGKSKRRERRPAPQAPPPGWRPPAGYIPVTVRRRRKWPWFGLLTLLCCCGVPAYLAGPMLQQYPASAALPEKVADLQLRDDDASKRTTGRLEREMQVTYWAKDTFAGVYTATNGKRVVVFGATGFRLSPDKDVDAEIDRLREAYHLEDVQPVDTGIRGEHQRCGIGRTDGESVVVCTWADHGSIASGVFDRLSVDDSARLLGELRTSIVSRG